MELEHACEPMVLHRHKLFSLIIAAISETILTWTSADQPVEASEDLSQAYMPDSVKHLLEVHEGFLCITV